MASELTDVNCTYECTTPKAYGVIPDGQTKIKFVSKQYSQLDKDNPRRGDDVVLTVESWFAEKIELL